MIVAHSVVPTSYAFTTILITRNLCRWTSQGATYSLLIQGCHAGGGAGGLVKVELISILNSIVYLLLSSRFILNLPDEELNSLERLYFQVEQASAQICESHLVDFDFFIYSHWFYEDFIREENTKLPSMPLKKFSEMLFHACPLLQQWRHDHEEAFKHFMQYKTRVPVCGAIMLNDAMDKVIWPLFHPSLILSTFQPVCSRERLEVVIQLGFSQRQDKWNRATCVVCGSRGIFRYLPVTYYSNGRHPCIADRC